MQSLTTHRPPEDLLAAARELGLRPERVTRRRYRVLAMLVAACVALVPWIFYVGISMPSGYRTRAWSAAWVGFDLLLLAALLGTAISALLRRKIVILLAIVTATLLICDAWFDVALDWGTSDVWGSLASAAFLELPLAVFLLNWARTLVRVMLALHWKELGLPGKPPPLHRIPLLAPPAPRSGVDTVAATGFGSNTGPATAIATSSAPTADRSFDLVLCADSGNRSVS